MIKQIPNGYPRTENTGRKINLKDEVNRFARVEGGIAEPEHLE